MNKITRSSDLMIPKVTTGPLPASRKIYVAPEQHPDVHVPLREIALSVDSGEPPFRVYDPSGPYTDDAVQIDVEKGLPRQRSTWIEARGGIESYQGRQLKPEDNCNVSGSHAARGVPNKPQPMRGIGSAPGTKY